jgi:molecular chaperone DnaK
MARTKIDYGIDLGTTNSAISRIDKGEVKIIKSLDKQSDTSPSCVAYNKKGSVLVGDAEYRSYHSDSSKSLAKNSPLNAFVEFKRTMGTDKTYHSTNISKDLTSEELSAEVLKRLKEYVSDENINAAVITVPAAFKNNQIDATRKAAKLAGFDHVEVLQEPAAAAIAYGLNNKKKDGFWLVFDYGGGTFDAALLKVEEGIMKVIDTEGDNYLGGKNLDYAVVDQIIIPHIQENYEINGILSDDVKKAEYRGALKFFAEEIKNNLSFNSSHNIYVDPGDCGEDDNGDEIAIDLTVTQDQLKEVLAPIFQKAIDWAVALLRRNNLQGSSLDSLILVGGPTLSPIVREMLEKQICKPDTSVDPMTVVSTGAALYASTVELSEEIIDQNRDETKIQLEIGHEASTVEKEEFVTIKILEDKTEGTIPEKVLAEIKRGDNAWASGKVEINSLGEVIDVQLNEGKTNVFVVTLYDDKGNLLECEPNSFNVIQGSVVGSATLPYNIGIEIQDINSGKVLFRTVAGLEKNKSLPAIGAINNLKTPRQIRPGMESDYLEISIFQGEHGAEGSRAIHNHHVSSIYITGNDLPALLPENTDVDITVNVDMSQKITGKAYFTAIDFEYDFECETVTDHIETTWLANEFKKGLDAVNELKRKGINSEELDQAEKDIKEGKNLFESSKDDIDTKQQALSNLRKSIKLVDKLLGEREWPELEKELKDAFHGLEEVNREKGNEQTTQMVEKIRPDVEQALRDQDSKNAQHLIEIISSMSFELERIEHLMGFILYVEKDFDNIPWRDRSAAKNQINRGKGILYDTPSIANLQPIVNDLFENGRFDEKKTSNGPNVPQGTLRG